MTTYRLAWSACRAVRTYHDRVYRYGKRVCRNGFDAADAVQEAFVKLARRPDMLAHPGDARPRGPDRRRDLRRAGTRARGDEDAPTPRTRQVARKAA